MISAAAAVFVNFDEDVPSDDDSDCEGDVLASTSELLKMQEIECEYAQMIAAQLGESEVVVVKQNLPCYTQFVEVADPEFQVEKVGERLFARVVMQELPEEFEVTVDDFS